MYYNILEPRGSKNLLHGIQKLNCGSIMSNQIFTNLFTYLQSAFQEAHKPNFTHIIFKFNLKKLIARFTQPAIYDSNSQKAVSGF